MVKHQPLVVGLTICHDVSRDPGRGEVSIHRSFTGIACEFFPAALTPFCVHCCLTDGEGTGELMLTVTSLADPMEEARRIVHPIRFRERLDLIDCVIRVNRCVFPAAGMYSVSLFLDGEWLAQRSLRVYLREEFR